MLSNTIRNSLHRIAPEHQPSDADLLERFVEAQDQRAFADLVDRHRGKVFAVCKRLLGDHHLAEEAFQATFLVLARKAAQVQPRSAVAGFLYGVARKAALETSALHRRRKETLMQLVPDHPGQQHAGPDAETLALLDEEIANLSDTLRSAVVLCELDGVSRAAAARQLGIAEGTLSSRLAAARKRLAQRLRERGVTFSSGLVAALVESTQDSMPPILVAPTAPAQAIARRVLGSMLLSRLGKVVLCLLLLPLWGVWWGWQPLGEAPAAPVPRPRPAAPELIWLHDTASNHLIAYSPAGLRMREVKLPADQPFLGLTPDGGHILHAGKSGNRLTYQVRGMDPESRSIDLGLDYSPHDLHPLWNHAGTQFIRRRSEDPKQLVGVRSTILTYHVFDVATRTATLIQQPAHHWVLGWTPDQKRFVTMDVGNHKKRNGDLFVMETTGEPTLLRRVGDQFIAHQDIAPSRDGRTFLVGGVKDTPPGQEWHHALWSVDSGTGEVVQRMHESGQGFTRACWSPDERRMCVLWAYTKDASSGKGWDQLRVTLANADGRQRTTVTLRDKARGEDPYKEARTRFARCGCFWYNRSRDADDTVVVSL